jgi:hypothetical protein
MHQLFKDEDAAKIHTMRRYRDIRKNMLDIVFLRENYIYPLYK